MENPFEIIIDKLTSIENRIAYIEAQISSKKVTKKKKVPLITKEEADKYILRTVFNIPPELILAKKNAQSLSEPPAS